MIEVNSKPAIEVAPGAGWQLVFSMGQPFDYTTPFRIALRGIAEALNSRVDLPEYEAFEDFVEGTLDFGGHVLGIYYEHSLSYLSLSCDRKETLIEIEKLLRPDVKVSWR